MAGPASFATVVKSTDLLMGGKGAVESKGAVIKFLSRTGRIGSLFPAAGSRVNATSNRVPCAFKMVFRGRAF